MCGEVFFFRLAGSNEFFLEKKVSVGFFSSQCRATTL